MDNTDGWIEHDGKGIPVKFGEYVDLRFRDGTVICNRDAGFWALHTPNPWVHSVAYPGHDIVAYKVVS